jgi:hypothetical protein
MSQFPLPADPSLSVQPTRLTTADIEFLNRWVTQHKTDYQGSFIQQIVARLIQNGKLTLEEIALCVNLPLTRVQWMKQHLMQF